MNVDWRRLKAVVLQSDDWGLCAWSADEQAHRVLADTPAFRSPAGRRYGGSTLESADDVRRLAGTLLEFRGADGFPPVWQANTIVASPDYLAMDPPLFESDAPPLTDFPNTPHRWHRPGLWGELDTALEAGVWWPELHGLHHLPEHAWLTALRRGAADARRAHEQQSPVCEAVEASGEYDPGEPLETRARCLAGALERFQRAFGRAPTSCCPPDYRWDDWLEGELARAGVGVLQGKAEQHTAALPVVRRLVRAARWPLETGALFAMPPRVAFEPCGAEQRLDKVGPAAAARRVREAWSLGRPAVVSSHRLNYAHLQPGWSEDGRAALRDLLASLCDAGARFLTDAEVYALQTRGRSVRPIGRRGVLVRLHGAGREPLRIALPAGVTGARVREGEDGAGLVVDGGACELRAERGEYVIEWRRA